MAALRLPDVRITEAVAMSREQAPTADVHVAHCRITGVIGREIRFMVLLPDSWNGSFMMGGGGGYVGSIQNSAAGSMDRRIRDGRDRHRASVDRHRRALGARQRRASAELRALWRFIGPRRPQKRSSARTTAATRAMRISRAAPPADGRR